MKFPDIYTIGMWLKTAAAKYIVIAFCGMVIGVIAVPDYYSRENQLRLNSVQAAEKFVYTVETEYPRSLVSVRYALLDMRAAYEQTGEGDPVRLEQLTRLEDWLVRSHSAGEEQAFLTEVRRHGKVATHEPWFSSWSRIILSILIVEILGVFLIAVANALLSKMDPRLRPSRVTGK